MAFKTVLEALFSTDYLTYTKKFPSCQSYFQHSKNAHQKQRQSYYVSEKFLSEERGVDLKNRIMSIGLDQHLHIPSFETFLLDQGRVIESNSILITLFWKRTITNIQGQHLINLHEEDDSKKF